MTDLNHSLLLDSLRRACDAGSAVRVRTLDGGQCEGTPADVSGDWLTLRCQPALMPEGREIAMFIPWRGITQIDMSLGLTQDWSGEDD